MVHGEAQMKFTSVCLLAILACSCREAGNSPTPGQPEATMERREEVRKVISNYLHHANVDIVRGPLTVGDVRKELAEVGRKLGEVPGWTELKPKLQQGDELYFYKTDLRSWAELRGREGYVAIRGNEVIGSLLTFMN